MKNTPDEKLVAELRTQIREDRAAKLICEMAKTGQCDSCSCMWRLPHYASEIPKPHLRVCRGVRIEFVPVGHARHCAKCDRSEAACRCRVPELIEREAKP